MIAGRAAPGATVELLRNGAMHARVASDSSGLFAFVPQPLPPGTNEILLQSIAPDGTRMQSRDSITVVVGEKRDTRPLVALTSPDKPTVVLSSPDEQALPGTKPGASEASKTAGLGEPVVGAARSPETSSTPPGTEPGPQGAPTTGAEPPPAPAPAAAAPTKTRSQVRIASVEAEEGGRLFVSGRAAPGATVRLYLNETLVAPGGAGSDGRISFAIGRGVRPGGYRVRLDDVDPVSGDVKSRAEVEFKVPAPLTVELPPAVEPYVTDPPVVTARAPDTPQPSAPGFSGAPTVERARQGASASSLPSAQAKAPPDPGRQASTELPFRDGLVEVEATVPVGRSPAANAVASAEQSAAADAAFRQLETGTILVPEINTAIVGRGDNLWRISRRVYGRGVRYSVIYTANQEQIRSPGLIYPGQLFVLPAEAPQASTR